MFTAKPFSKIRELLECDGWTFQRVQGNRRLFTKPGSSILSFPVHRKMVAPEYVKRILKLLSEQNPPQQRGRRKP